MAVQRGKCNHKKPQSGDLKVVNDKIETAKTMSQTGRTRNARNGVLMCKQCITIDTYFWTFHGTRTFEGNPLYNPTMAQLENHFDILVKAFRDTPFTFRLAGNQIFTNQAAYIDMAAVDDKIGSEQSTVSEDVIQ